MAKYPFNSRRSRMNPVGQASYLDTMVSRSDRSTVKKAEFFPSEEARYSEDQISYDESGRMITPDEDPTGPVTAARRAAPSYGNKLFRTQARNISYSKDGPYRAKGGLAAFLDGWTEQDENRQRADHYAKRQFRVTPRKTSTVAKGETNVDYWSGGFDALKRMGSSFILSVGGETYDFGNLAPWSPENPQGTGVWRDIASRMLVGTVRGDEAFAAQHFLRSTISPTLRKFTRGETSVTHAQPIISKAFKNILFAIYGSDAPPVVNAANIAGIERLRQDAIEEEMGASGRDGARAVGSPEARRASVLERAQRTGRATDPRLAPSRPAVAQVEPSVEAPPAVVRAMETAAAAVTAPVTPAHPVEAKIRVLRRMGVNERIIARILATSSVAEQMEFIDDVMAGWSN